LATLTNGNLKAIYCSSGIYGAKPYPDLEDLEGIEIISKARNYGYYEDPSNFISTPYGECIMTCENGEYSVSGVELTLDITMIPQVAQFTIRGLDYGDNYIVGYAGTIDSYAGGKITAGGVVLEPLGTLDGNHKALVHDNKDGISIYASPWQEVPAGFEAAVASKGGLGFFAFLLSTENGHIGNRSFTGKSSLKNGGAVIFDGPYSGGVSKWN